MFAFKLKKSLRKGRRPAVALEVERELLARLRAMPRPVDFVNAEVYRRLRVHLNQHQTLDGLPQSLAQAADTIFPPAPVSGAIRTSVERDTQDLTNRQCAWLQAAELLIAGGTPWSLWEPTAIERASMAEHRWPAKLATCSAQIRGQWARINAMQVQELTRGLDYLQPPIAAPQLAPWHDDDRKRSVTTKETQRVLLHRVAARFGGRGRRLSLDSGVAQLLEITQTSAIYLRKTVERLLKRKFHLPRR